MEKHNSNAEKTFEDRMGCAQMPDIVATFDTDKDEKVVYSCVVAKINRWGMKQDRTLLLTNFNLFNIKDKKKVQRKILLSSIKAITMSTKDKNPEFVVHIRSEYDYRYESDFRDEIFAAIKYTTWKLCKLNLPVYGVPSKLKEFHTSKKDISQGVEVNPPEEFRLAD